MRFAPKRTRMSVAAGIAAITAASALSVAGGLASQASADPPAQVGAMQIGSVPQLGWNDWNAFHCNVNEQLVEQTADAMVADGMKAAGYQYVNIDDCWLESQRDANGNLVPDPTKFPDGINAVADYVHKDGLKLGIYEDAGSATCAGFPGSLGHEQQDANLFASWGVDYLKYDNCNTTGLDNTQQTINRFAAMGTALKNTGRPIFYAVCDQGTDQPWNWAAQIGGQSWRTTDDIGDSFDSMLSIFQENVFLYPYSHAGAFNDPDMLEIGNGGMTTTEYQSEYSLWAAMDAPLIAGTDLRSISPADLAIYTNKNVIAVDQDPLAAQAVPIANGGLPAGDNGLWVLSKPLANGDRAVVLFNSNGTPQTINTSAAAVGLGHASSYTLDNLWTNQVTETAGAISANIPAHGVVMYRISTKGGSQAAPDVSVTTSGLTASPTPGTPSPVTVTAVNNGAQQAHNISIKLTVPSGWTVTPSTSSTIRSLGTGQSTKVTFQVTAAPPTSAIEVDTVTAGVTWQGNNPGQTGSASASGQFTEALPVQAPFQTFSSATDATPLFGQNGNTFAVQGGGSDLWVGFDDYTTIYQSSVVGTNSTVETEVTGTNDLSGFGKTGILVRNSIPSANQAPEGVILFASPSGGIQLEWDSNAGQFIDSVDPANGTIPETVPVHLRLVRSGDTYTGFFSTDGTTWQMVGSATVPGQADAQDAGMFITSHTAGSLAEGDFNGFTVS